MISCFVALHLPIFNGTHLRVSITAIRGRCVLLPASLVIAILYTRAYVYEWSRGGKFMIRNSKWSDFFVFGFRIGSAKQNMQISELEKSKSRECLDLVSNHSLTHTTPNEKSYDGRVELLFRIN